MNLDGEPSDELSKSGVTVKFFRRFAKQYFLGANIFMTKLALQQACGKSQLNRRWTRMNADLEIDHDVI